MQAVKEKRYMCVCVYAGLAWGRQVEGCITHIAQNEISTRGTSSLGSKRPTEVTSGGPAR